MYITFKLYQILLRIDEWLTMACPVLKIQYMRNVCTLCFTLIAQKTLYSFWKCTGLTMCVMR